MIYHGKKKISKVFHGDREISRVYRGDKLVFQNKLIPGVDYERYQWLKKEFFTPSTNAYLLLSSDYVDFLEFDFIAQYTDKGTAETNKYISILMTNESYVGALGLSAFTMYKGLYLRGNGEVIRTEISDFKMDIKHVNLTKDDDSYILTVNNFSVRNATTKGGITIGPKTNSQGEVFYKNVHFIHNNIECFLNPIKLRRNIAASVSADNKPHPAGECGMIDEISGKFYGNANSSGAFSVSNE